MKPHGRMVSSSSGMPGIDIILRQASRWYDVDVTYTNKIPEREFNGRISRNVKASAIIKYVKVYRR
jgi:transmembrane sensor